MERKSSRNGPPWSKFKTLAFLVNRENRHTFRREPKPMKYHVISDEERKRVLECLKCRDMKLNEFQEAVVQRFLGREYALAIGKLDLAMGRLRLYPPEDYPKDFDDARTNSWELLTEAGMLFRLAVKHSSNLDNLFFDGVDYADVVADLDDYAFKRYIANEFSPIREAFTQSYDNWRRSNSTKKHFDAARARAEMNAILAGFAHWQESIEKSRKKG